MSLITPSKHTFSKWYEDIIIQSGLAIHGLVKGTVLFAPRSTYIWEKIQSHLNTSFSLYNIQNVMFPTLIPTSEIEKEKSSLTGFMPELFNVCSSSSIDNKTSIFLRPTSEILFSHYFKSNLESYDDLPICLNQWCSVFRAEKNTKLFLRSCEFHWQEAHTIHKSKEQAEEYLAYFHSSYQKLITKLLNIAYITGEKTVCERFVGATKTLTIESIMPDGQVLQMATSHDLSQNFAKTFDIQYTDNENTRVHPYQLSAGCSTRLIGALIMSHSDDKGLVLPWNLNKAQIRILVMDLCLTPLDKIYKDISEQIKGFDYEWDFSLDSFGKKMTDSELQGVPVVLVVGKKEMDSNQIMFKCRTSSDKKHITLNEISAEVNEVYKNYDKNLLAKSQANLDSSIVAASNLQEIKEAIANQKVVIAPWFDDEENEVAFKNAAFGFTPRCIKERINSSDAKCFFSGKNANCYAYFGRSY